MGSNNREKSNIAIARLAKINSEPKNHFTFSKIIFADYTATQNISNQIFRNGDFLKSIMLNTFIN